jgi:hypothetical protein
MARNSLSPTQRRALVAQAEDIARRATEALLNQALNKHAEILSRRSPFSTPMRKVAEKTARKILNRRFKGERRGRKRTYSLGYFGDVNVLDRGAQLAAEGIGASKAAEIIHEELKAEYKKIDVPTVSAIKGRLERSRR